MRRSSSAESFPYARQLRDLPWLPHWESPAFAWTLGRLYENTLDAGSGRITTTLQNAMALARVAERPQRAAYISLQKDLAGKSIEGIIVSRLSKHFPEHSAQFAAIDWEHMRTALNKSNSRIMHSAMKSWLGGWCTSHRLHEDSRLPCLFGCPAGEAEDSWLHYGQCRKLWLITYRELGAPMPPDLPTRFGLVLCPGAFNAIAVTFDVYHTLKLSPELLRGHLARLDKQPPAGNPARYAFLNDVQLFLSPIVSASVRRLCS